MEHHMWARSLLSHLEGELNTELIPKPPGAVPTVATVIQSPSLLLSATHMLACCATHFCP